MDALTSFELEAQRRRETVANDRDNTLARAMATPERTESVVVAPTTMRAAQPARVTADGDCQPASLTRQSAA